MTGFAWIAWSAYQENNQTPISQLPVVKADSTTIKHKPDDEGGMKIPHKDKEVYAAITDTKAGDNVETLLPREEEPISLQKRIIVADELQKGKRVFVDDELKKGKTIVVDEELTKIKTVDVDGELKRKGIQAFETIPESKDSIVKFAVKPVFKPTPPVKKIAVASNNSSNNKGDFSIQLGAYKTNSEANKAWGKINSSHSNLIGNLNYYVKKVVIENDDFYRLRAGYFTTREKATSLCYKLKAKNQGCFAVN